MTELSLVESIESSSARKHTLLSWVTSNLEEVNRIDASEYDSQTQFPLRICDELDTFVRYNAELADEEQIDSHYIFLSVSQLYNLVLLRLERTKPGKIYDCAELLAKVLSEDDVAIERDDMEKKKKKKSTKKRSYVRSPAKEMACVVTTQLFETFDGQLSSLAPLLFEVIFKNFKKIMEKSKYAHATFATSLMRLTNAILKHAGGLSFYNEYFAKFTKLSKKVFEAICSDKQDFSIDLVSAIMEIWSNYFRRESFLKDNKGNLENAIVANYADGELGTLGFANDFSRPVIARTLAEVMFHYCKIAGLLSTEQILRVYATLFLRSSGRDVQAGVFESVVHFLGLCLSADGNFFKGGRYLEVVRCLASSIFCPSQTVKQKMDSLSRTLRYFGYMHKLLLPRIGESSKNLMILQLLGSDNKAASPGCESPVSSDSELLWLNLAQLDLAELLLSELSSSFGNERHLVHQIKKKLTELSTCDNFTLRIHSSRVLRLFLSVFPQFLGEAIENSLEALSKSFKQNDEFPFAVNHGHALVIANLIGCADKDYVPFELIMRITVFATSFIKNHTTTTDTPLYSKGLLCWILLIGCMNYKDDRYLQMQSSQLFLFWKVLLTHNYSSREDDDLYRNLETRNHALTCLLTFLGNESIGNKSVAKQVSYLLTKCSNFNHSITQKSGKIDKALLTNELRLLQIHLRLHKYIKDDFNSSLLILIMKNFSDPNLYSEGTHSFFDSLKSVGDGKKATNTDRSQNFGEPSVITLLRQNDGFAYGISSRLSTRSVAELNIRRQPESREDIDRHFDGCDWCFEFENEVTKPISSMLSLDYFVTLYCPEGYVSSDKYSPRITTALIDASMEVFSLKFPYLNDKIQYSIIENLNSSMFCKTTSPLRNVAIAANILISLNKALKIMHAQGLPLKYSVGELLLKSVEKLKFDNDYQLIEMKAECVGLTCGTIKKSHDEEMSEVDMVSEQVNVFIKDLIKIEEPFIRILRALSLVNIHKYRPSGASFSRIFDIITSLINDPHPVVHCWSLKAMQLLIEKHVAMDHAQASSLLTCLETVSTDPLYGMCGSSVLRYNYCLEFDPQLTVGKILKSLAETFGPCIPELPGNVRTIFRSLVYGLAFSNIAARQLLAIEIYGDLAILKIRTLDDQLLIKLARSIINGAIVIGFGSTYFNCHLTRKCDIFSSTSSPSSAMKCFDLFSLLMKLQKGHLFVQDLDIASWRWLSLSPSSKSLSGYMFAWMDQTSKDELKWFDKLYVIFNITEWRLFLGYYKGLNGLLKKLGLESDVESDFSAEEEKSIAQGRLSDQKDGSQNASDLLPWRARFLLLRMVKHLCLTSIRDEKTSPLLSQKIPELIKLSFQASTSNIPLVKSLGLEILRVILKNNSSQAGVGNQGTSELEQQEAQIVSAMMPAFSSGTPPDIVVSAIDLSAEILTSGISSVRRMDRVVQLLIDYLVIFNDNKSSVKLGDALIVTQKSKKKIELSILSAWAELVQKSVTTGGSDLKQFTENYWDILVPLWIMSLREYAMVKYEGKRTDEFTGGKVQESFFESDGSKLELFEGAWLNMVVALSCILEVRPQLVLQRLNEPETESFMLILLIQCIEIVVKSVDDSATLMKVLPAVDNLLKCCVPLDPLFEDGTNEELVSILDRLMTMGNSDEKLILVQIIDDLIVRYIKKNDTHETFLEGIDKLYELLRLLLKPISQVLPFIRYNSLEDSDSKNPVLEESELLLLRKAFAALESNVSKFDDLFKVDLYSCLLFIIGEIFESDEREETIPIVLPLLRSIAANLNKGDMNESLVKTFFDSIKKVLFEKVELLNQLATCFILLASNFTNFTQNDLNNFVAVILSGLRNSETQTITMHGLTTLINKGWEDNCSRYIIKNVILEISQSIASEDDETAKLMLGFIHRFVERVHDIEPRSLSTAMSLMLSLEILYCEKGEGRYEGAGSRLLSLLAINKESFRVATKGLSEKQRDLIEDLMERSPEFGGGNKSDRKNDLSLKTFV